MLRFYNTVNSLCFYRNILNNPTFEKFLNLIKELSKPDYSFKDAYKTYFELKSEIANFILKEENYTASTPWKNFVISLILEENLVNKSLTDFSEFPLKETLYFDLNILSSLFNFNFKNIVEILDNTGLNIFNEIVSDKESLLSIHLSEADSKGVIESLIEFCKTKNLDVIDLNKVFKVNKNEELFLSPINPKVEKKLSDLVGYNKQKQSLLSNTLSLINGTGGLNTLLYGDMGTGKSSMIMSLINEFKDSDLRLIEVKKNELGYLPRVFNTISEYDYPFIIFIDDLSFDSGDDSYKELKNYLEGSLENIPKNILLYATSNKRTLVSQSKTERDDAVNKKEVLEEKLSLVSRFGLMIPFNVPNQEVYLKIVETLLEREGIPYTKEIKDEAIKWELRHMNRSGRTAEQFVQYLKTKN